MIVNRSDATLLLITQTDHAALSGFLARHWGNDFFAKPQPFDAVCKAAAEHDNGWKEWDAAPRVNPATRIPFQFWELPVEEHLDLYWRGVERVVARDRYAGLLVSMHLTGLYNQRFGTDVGLSARRFSESEDRVIKTYLKRLEAQQQELRASVAASTEEDAAVWTNYRLLQIYDRLSLYVCMLPCSAKALGPTPRNYADQTVDLKLAPEGDGAIRIAPYPFDVNPLRVSVPARRTPALEYARDEAFRRALAEGESGTLEVVLQAGAEA